MADPVFRRLVYDCHLVRFEITRSQRIVISNTFFIENESEQFPRISRFIRRELPVVSFVNLLIFSIIFFNFILLFI